MGEISIFQIWNRMANLQNIRRVRLMVGIADAIKNLSNSKNIWELHRFSAQLISMWNSSQIYWL